MFNKTQIVSKQTVNYSNLYNLVCKKTHILLTLNYKSNWRCHGSHGRSLGCGISLFRSSTSLINHMLKNLLSFVGHSFEKYLWYVFYSHLSFVEHNFEKYLYIFHSFNQLHLAIPLSQWEFGVSSLSCLQ